MQDSDDDPIVRAVRAARTMLDGLLDARLAGPDRAAALAAARELRDWLSVRVDGAEPEAVPPPPAAADAVEAPDAVDGGDRADAVDGPDGAAGADAEPPSYVQKQLSLGGARLVVPARLVERPAPVPLPRPARSPAPPVFDTAGSGAPGGDGYPEAHIDLDLLLERLDLKRRACAWALARRGEAADTWSDAARAEREELVDAARGLPSAYLWALHPGHEGVEEEVLELAQHAYENLALAVDVARRWSDSVAGQAEGPPDDLLYLAAEAQSALRAVLLAADVAKDADQIEAYIWVKEAAWERGTYVRRFMRREDPADPTRWADLRTRLGDLRETLDAEDREERARRKLVGSVEHRARELAQATPADRLRLWPAVFTLLERWVDEGRPPSSKEVCLPLLPHVDGMPDELEPPEGALRVLRAIDEMVAARQAAEEAGAEAEREAEPSPEVARAAELLRGKVVLLIGGERRPHEQRRLERDLELAELRWLSTRPHRSLDPLLTQIERPEVDLVIVAVRWSDHAFADLRKPAEAAGKPFVQLPGGYGTNQVAHQVLQQVSRQL